MARNDRNAVLMLLAALVTVPALADTTAAVATPAYPPTSTVGVAVRTAACWSPCR